jgi:hypothetical protein
MLKIFEEDLGFHLPNRRVASFILSFLGVACVALWQAFPQTKKYSFLMISP